MCGIAGFIDNKIGKAEAEALIERMLESIAHRGPDARSTYVQLPVVLGHNRLSILDLSPDGNQPMQGHGFWIVFNGEIYNYLEIREELKAKGYSFHTGSDTEVVLASYKEYGSACVNRFVGMWALAIWDDEKKELFCSRDRFGIKPFYYLHNGTSFYFGSEYKALKESPIFNREINLKQVSRGLQLGWVCYEDETYFSKLKSLEAAHNLIYSNGKIKVEKYWDLIESNDNHLDPDEAANKLRELLESSVNIHMRADVEIAICLSGGIDSSSLTGLIAKGFPSNRFNSYSIYFDGLGEVDERPYIQEVINKYPSINPAYFKPTPDEILERFDKIMYQVDVPSTGSSNFSHYFLLEKIRAEGIKVVVDGQGADEYLGGYMHSMYRLNADSIRNIRIKEVINNIYYQNKYQQHTVGQLFSNVGKSILSTFMSEERLYQFEYKNYCPFVSIDKGDVGSLNLKSEFMGNKLNTFLYKLLFTSSLPTILHYVDRMTMAHSIESRVPLLDHRLVEFAFSLSNQSKIKNGVTKKVLRESVKDLLPPKIYQRRDKKGFVTPGEDVWLRGGLKHLLDLDYQNLYFLDKSKVKKVVANYKNGDQRNAKLVWRLATLNYWLKSNV